MKKKSLKTMVAVGTVALVAAGQAQAVAKQEAQTKQNAQEKEAQPKQPNASFKSSLLKDASAIKAATLVAGGDKGSSNKEWQGE